MAASASLIATALAGCVAEGHRRITIQILGNTISYDETADGYKSSLDPVGQLLFGIEDDEQPDGATDESEPEPDDSGDSG